MLLLSSKIKLFSIFDCIVLRNKWGSNWVELVLIWIAPLSSVNQSPAVGAWFDRKGIS
jgi:hypothetical protein